MASRRLQSRTNLSVPATMRYLYEVRLKDGTTNRQFTKFFENVTRLNARPPDYAGIQSVCILSHHMDAESVHVMCTDRFRGSENDVTVTEITATSLASRSSAHAAYTISFKHAFCHTTTNPNIKMAS